MEERHGRYRRVHAESSAARTSGGDVQRRAAATPPADGERRWAMIALLLVNTVGLGALAHQSVDRQYDVSQMVVREGEKARLASGSKAEADVAAAPAADPQGRCGRGWGLPRPISGHVRAW